MYTVAIVVDLYYVVSKKGFQKGCIFIAPLSGLSPLLLTEVDTRTTGDMNLSVSVDSLRISTLTGAEVINHSLPSISFASGGDGVSV